MLTTIVGVSPAEASGGFFEGSVVRAPAAEAEMLDTMNRTRAHYGLAPLRSKDWGVNENYLNCIASQNASQGALQHYPSSCGQSFVEAEILAARYSSFSGGSTNTLVMQWNDSQGHREIMLAADADFASVGVFCIGHTSWAIAWIGADVGHIQPNTTAKKNIELPFFTDNDYNCKDSTAVAANNPLGAHVPADSLEELVNQSGFDGQKADVLRLYRAFFDRDAEIGGANYWLSLRAGGYSIDQISYQFAASEEFQLTYGTVTNRRYLEILYQNVLGRQPDATGFNYWLGLLESGQLDRGGIVRWVAANEEFTSRHQYGGY